MQHDILLALWFPLPAAAANVAPIIAAAIPFLRPYDAPLDGGRMFRGHRIFGPHKTWRGIIAGILVATLTLWLQQLLAAHVDWIQSLVGNVDYAVLPTLLLGPLFAVGALGGDAIESFFKRQRNISAGARWIPYDQLDYIVGSVVISLFFVILTPRQYLWIFFIWFFMHILASYVGYRLRLKESPI